MKLGTNIGHYQVVSVVAVGGMGEVFRARDTRLGRDVAIKILPSTVTTDRDRLRRFEQEARALASLTHPNILIVHEIGTHEDTPFIVSEFLDGRTLRAVFSEAPLTVRKTVEYGRQICQALSAAHEKGIVHRDLKPENIFVTSDGRLKILDFGLAKLIGEASPLSQGSGSQVPTKTVETTPGIVMGTVGYMSPEQVRGQTVDHRSDIFAFGAILYEALSGERAFKGSTPADTVSAILSGSVPDLSALRNDVPPVLARLVHRCLEKSPAERFQSASDLGFALENALATGTSTLHVPQSPSSKWWRRSVAVLMTCGLLSLFLLVNYPARSAPDILRLRVPEILT